jgi:hypothetical protein
MQKHVKQFFKILRLLTYIEKKMGQICQSYHVINIFFISFQMGSYDSD